MTCSGGGSRWRTRRTAVGSYRLQEGVGGDLWNKILRWAEACKVVLNELLKALSLNSGFHVRHLSYLILKIFRLLLWLRKLTLLPAVSWTCKYRNMPLTDSTFDTTHLCFIVRPHTLRVPAPTEGVPVTAGLGLCDGDGVGRHRPSSTGKAPGPQRRRIVPCRGGNHIGPRFTRRALNAMLIH